MGCSNSSNEVLETPINKARNFEKFKKEFLSYKEFVIDENEEKSIYEKSSKFAINKISLDCNKNYKNQKEILNNNSNNVKNWIDDIFQPDIETLLGNTIYEGVSIDKSKLIILRLEEIYGFDSYDIFPSEFEILDDINQCNKNNVYYYTLFKILTKYSLIFQNFKSFDVKSNGQYSVTIKIDGEWCNVYIDDYIICDKFTKKPIFLSSEGKSNKKFNVFLILLEKAWAKVNGGYLKIQNYNLVYKDIEKSYDEIFDILSSFTDFPINYVYHNESINLSSILWNKLNELSKSESKFIVISKVDDSNPIICKYKLSKFSLYIFESIKEILIDNKLCKMVILKYYYKNSIKDDITIEIDDNVNEKIKDSNKSQNILITEENEKNHFMLSISLEEYVKYFESTYIIDLKPFHYKTVIKCNHKIEPHPLIFKFNIKKDSFFHINSIKPSFRFNNDISMNLEMQMNLILCKIIDNEATYITSTHHHKKNPYISEILDSGEYYISVHALYLIRTDNLTKIFDFLIEVYSDDYLSLKYTFDSNFNLTRACLSGLLIDKNEDKIIQDKERKVISVINTNDFNNLDFNDENHYSNISGFCSYGLIVIQNFLKNEIIFTIKDNSINFVLLYPSWKDLEQNNVIRLKKDEIFIILGIKKNYEKNSLLLITPEIVKDFYSINTNNFKDYCNCDIGFIDKKGKLSKSSLSRYFNLNEIDLNIKEKELKEIFYRNLYKLEFELFEEFQKFSGENIEKLKIKNSNLSNEEDSGDFSENGEIFIDESEYLKFDLENNSFIFGETNYLKVEMDEDISVIDNQSSNKNKKMTLLKKIFHGMCLLKNEFVTIIGSFSKNIPDGVCLIKFQSSTKLLINFTHGYPNGIGFQKEVIGEEFFVRYIKGENVEY